jgi:hypothetical protein
MKTHRTAPCRYASQYMPEMYGPARTPQGGRIRGNIEQAAGDSSHQVVGMDDFKDTLTDIIALAVRVILLAPPDQRRALCAYALDELGDTIEHIIGHEELTH